MERPICTHLVLFVLFCVSQHNAHPYSKRLLMYDGHDLDSRIAAVESQLKMLNNTVFAVVARFTEQVASNQSSGVGALANKIDSMNKTVTDLHYSMEIEKEKHCETGRVVLKENCLFGVGGRCTDTAQTVTFQTKFQQIPKLMYSIVNLDVSNEDNTRVSVLESGLSNTGFNLTLHEWMATKVYRVEVMWMVCSN